MKSTRLCLGLLCGALTVSMLLGVREVKHEPAAESRLQTLAAVPMMPAIVRALRPNYPFSVIPGGAYSAHELQRTAERDGVVRSHYSGFKIKSARLIVAAQDTLQYASYRMNGKVYWTQGRLLIPKGEVLITDGTRLARTRCGNRLSESPVPEVALREPALHDLSLPEFSVEMLRNGSLTFAKPPSSDSVGFPDRPILTGSRSELMADTSWPPLPALLPKSMPFPGLFNAAYGSEFRLISTRQSGRSYAASQLPSSGAPMTPSTVVAQVPEPGPVPMFAICLAGSAWALCRMKRLPPLPQKIVEKPARNAPE